MAEPRGVRLRRVVGEGSRGGGHGNVWGLQSRQQEESVLLGVLWLVLEQEGRPWRAQEMLQLRG